MTYTRLIPGPAEVILARHILTSPASIRSYDVPMSKSTFKYVAVRSGLHKVAINPTEVIYLPTDEAELWAIDIVYRDEHRPTLADYRDMKRARRRKLSKLSRLLPTPSQP